MIGDVFKLLAVTAGKVGLIGSHFAFRSVVAGPGGGANCARSARLNERRVGRNGPVDVIDIRFDAGTTTNWIGFRWRSRRGRYFRLGVLANEIATLCASGELPTIAR